MSAHLDGPPPARRWLVRVVTTLAAWFVAFLIVLALLILFGEELESLPYALNALVFTGVLVPVMGNLVMPVLSETVPRWVGKLSDARRPGSRAARPGPRGSPEA